MIEVREMTSRRDMKAFMAFPERLYRDHPYYVPKLVMDELNTLDPAKNPAFDYCRARSWMAFKDGEPAGRITGIISQRYIETWKLKRARFGWIDFIDDHEVSGALLGAVEAWAREEGLEGVHGPLGFCDLDREGMLVEGFDELDMFITNYNYPYYPAHLEHHGYAKDVDWVEHQVHVPGEIPERLERIEQAVMKRLGVRLVAFARKKDLLPYIDRMFGLVNEAYRDLYSVVLLSERQIQYYTKAFIDLIDLDYCKIVVDDAGNIVAFGLVMPSFSRALQRNRGRLFPFGFIPILRTLKKHDRIDMLLTAVRTDYRFKGVNAIVVASMGRSMQAKGVQWAETGPQLEHNLKVQAQWKLFDARQHRRRRCFYRAI